MAGFTTSALAFLRRQAAEKALGNTIPVPLVGDILANVLAVRKLKLDLDAMDKACKAHRAKPRR